MSKIASRTATLDVKEALKLVDLLEKCAERTSCDQTKRILLKAGCEIADLVLTENKMLRAA